MTGPVLMYLSDLQAVFSSWSWPSIIISATISLLAVRWMLSSSRKDIRGQTVVITGGGGALGKCLAHSFARSGCHLVLWDLRGAGAAAEELSSKYPEVEIRGVDGVDVSNYDLIQKEAKKILKDTQVDILVNNAGVLPGQKFFDADPDLLRRTIEVNTLAHFWTVRAFAPSMIERNSGHLVSVTSSAGLLGVPRMVDYCASKFGAVGFLEALRMELKFDIGATNVQTTTVCPYAIRTPLITGWQDMPALPQLEPEWVADQVVDGVRANKPLLVLPSTLYASIFMKYFCPSAVAEAVASVLGISKVMSTFEGRGKDWVMEKK